MMRQPQSSVGLNSRFSRGLVCAYNAATGQNEVKLYGRAPTSGVTRVANNFGVADNFAAGSDYLSVMDGADVSLTEATTLILRRPTDTTDRTGVAWGVNHGGTQSFMCYMPFSDGTIYYDFGSNRLTWSGYSKDSNELDCFVFSCSSDQDEQAIWYQGVREAVSTSTKSARTAATTDVYLNRGLEGGDEQDVYLFLVWNRKLSDAEIREISRNPWQIFEPITQLLPVAAPAASTSGVVPQRGGAQQVVPARPRVTQTGLASGLVELVTAQHGSLISGDKGADGGTGEAPVTSTRYGLGKGNATNVGYDWEFDTSRVSDFPLGGEARTVLAVLADWSTTSTFDEVLLHYGTNTGGQRFTLRTNNSDDHLRFEHGAGNVIFTDLPEFDDTGGGLIVCGISFPDSAALDNIQGFMGVNGRPQFSSVTGSTSTLNTTATTPEYQWISRTGQSQTLQSGKFLFGAIWDRKLSQTELSSLMANPFQIFEPRTRLLPVGAPAAVGGDTSIDATVDTFTLSEHQATITYDVNVNANTDTFTLTEHQATLTGDVEVIASVDTFTKTTYQATVDLNVSGNVQANTDTFTLSEHQATVSLDRNIAANADTFTLTEHQGTITLGVNVQAGTDAFTVTEHQATLTFDRNVLAATDAFTLTEHTANIAAGDWISTVDLPNIASNSTARNMARSGSRNIVSSRDQ